MVTHNLKMNNRIFILVASIILIGCDPTYYLKVDDCYVQKKNYEFGTIYTSLQHIVLGPEFYLIMDEIPGELKIDRDKIYLFMNNEKQEFDWPREEDRKSTYEAPFLEVFTNQGENRDTLVYADEFIKLKFYLDYRLPMRGEPHDSFSVNIQLTDMEHCLTESECESQKYEHSFTYNTRDDESEVRRTGQVTAGWWRNPNVEVCEVE